MGALKLDDPALEALLSHAVLKMLQADPRPTFIFDMEEASRDPAPQPQFSNAASLTPCRRFNVSSKELLDLETRDPRSRAFLDWAVSDVNASSKADVSTHRFGGMSWVKYTLDSRWRVVSGTWDNEMSQVASSNSSAGMLSKVPISFCPQMTILIMDAIHI